MKNCDLTLWLLVTLLFCMGGLLGFACYACGKQEGMLQYLEEEHALRYEDNRIRKTFEME